MRRASAQPALLYFVQLWGDALWTHCSATDTKQLAATFHSVRHPHEIDHPAVEYPELGELSPFPLG